MPTAVLIVNYRAYDDLARCLQSLMPFLDADDEVAVVDYESNNLALAQAVAGRPQVVTIPRSDNRGFAAGVNLAARATRAPYFLLLNPDTVVEGPVVRALEDWMTMHPETGVAGARVLNADGSLQPTARRFPDITTALGGRTSWLTEQFPGNWFSRRNLVSSTAEGPVEVDWLSGACFMTRRDVFERVGGFDESFYLYWEDADYCRRLSAAGLRHVYVPTAAVRHAGGRSAHHNLARSIRAFHRSAYRLYWKHTSGFGRLAAPAIRAALWLRGEQRVWSARRRQKYEPR